MKYNIVLVEWQDIHDGPDGWLDIAYIPSWLADTDDGIVTSVGFLIHETDSDIVLATDLCEKDDDCNSIGRIPKSVIRKITTLNAS